MSLQHELGLPQPIENPEQETIMNLVVTGTLLSKEGQRILRPLGLTDSQFNVLMLLGYQTENGEINQTKLGDMLVVNRSNVTGLIDRMEEAGWVERVADSTDRRVNRVRLTKNGRRLLEKAEKKYYERVFEVMAIWSLDEKKKLCRMLERLRARLRQE